MKVKPMFVTMQQFAVSFRFPMAVRIFMLIALLTGTLVIITPVCASKRCTDESLRVTILKKARLRQIQFRSPKITIPCDITGTPGRIVWKLNDRKGEAKQSGTLTLENPIIELQASRVSPGEYTLIVEVYGNSDKPEASDTVQISILQQGRGMAFLVGINDYDHGQSLSWMVDDARELQKRLIEKFDYLPSNVYSIYGYNGQIEINGKSTGGKVTKAVVEQEFQQFLKKARDTGAKHFLLYYCGHGQADDGTIKPEDKGRDELVMADFSTLWAHHWANDLLTELPKDNPQIGLSDITVIGLYQTARTNGNSAADRDVVFKDDAKNSQYYYIQSCRPNDVSYTDKPASDPENLGINHGFFGSALLRALDSSSSKGKEDLTVGRLQSRIDVAMQDIVAEASKKWKSPITQSLPDPLPGAPTRLRALQGSAAPREVVIVAFYGKKRLLNIRPGADPPQLLCDIQSGKPSKVLLSLLDADGKEKDHWTMPANYDVGLTPERLKMIGSKGQIKLTAYGTDPDRPDSTDTANITVLQSQGMAFIVAINDYANGNSLDWMVSDGEEVATQLITRFKYAKANVYTVFGRNGKVEVNGKKSNENVTKDVVEREFQKFLALAEASGAKHFFLYYCGHGQAMSDVNDPRNNGKDGLTLADKATIYAHSWADSLLTKIPKYDIENTAVTPRKLSDLTVIGLYQAGRDKGTVAVDRDDDVFENNPEKNARYYYIQSCKSGDYSWADKPKAAQDNLGIFHGFFGEAFLRVLNKLNPTDIRDLTGKRLWNRIDANLADIVKQAREKWKMPDLVQTLPETYGASADLPVLVNEK